MLKKFWKLSYYFQYFLPDTETVLRQSYVWSVVQIPVSAEGWIVTTPACTGAEQGQDVHCHKHSFSEKGRTGTLSSHWSFSDRSPGKHE